MKKKVTKEEIKKIAKLAKLEFSEEELNTFQAEFNAILEYIGEIEKCDTKGIESVHFLSHFLGEVLRNDEVSNKTSLTSEKALLNATKRTENGYFKVSKVVSKEEKE